MEDRYEPLKELGSGSFGLARLERDKKTKELVAVKYIERGKKNLYLQYVVGWKKFSDKLEQGVSFEVGIEIFSIDENNVQREIINHSSLRHPNIVRFKEVFLTPTHLAIVMEYAAGGELFERICTAGRFSEDEARFFFQQLISGVSYCHSMEICHRDLKLENTLLDGSATPLLKICDFGYSKSALLHSKPKSMVGTPAYIGPEVLLRKEYDGKVFISLSGRRNMSRIFCCDFDIRYYAAVWCIDVWSCGVTLYVMLVGGYPFEDPEDLRNFHKTIRRIMSVEYSIPDYVRVSTDCRHLLSRIFVADPSKRITIPEIKNYPWFLKNLPRELVESEKTNFEDIARDQPAQSVEEIMWIIQEARRPAEGSQVGEQSVLGMLDPDDVEADVDNSGDFMALV
ncbi:hypothetical protein HHK36_000442 [Tetracentron sinense]|uniref:non-specific serine/threonine protein kinase n=1 Tax=Tetracentron sinense TaxID=13715 RepID=A0A834ZWE1_TETSI|nr:hypothetical protein HHK36_000442 [Tetracentron sinense]